MTYLRPDSKSQVTIEYSDDHQPIRIEAIVVSTHTMSSFCQKTQSKRNKRS